ncbi:MAG: DUF1343 domain-containing protein [Thermoflexales bacterium]|nr:DUF1343 domain-containing protein [Thermoflexales bacterium]
MKTRVEPGLDRLLSDDAARMLAGQRIGLVTSASSVTRNVVPTRDALLDAGVQLVALFGPEHGFSATVADAELVPSGRDHRSGLPIYSLFGDVYKPTPEMLADIDTLVYDLQDVGVRFYTFTTTLAFLLEACAEHHRPLIVLDRPNPVTGLMIEGPLMEPQQQTFLGHGPLPLRYGLTLGELAHFYNRELNIGAALQVVTIRGWNRAHWYDQTDLLWVPPSPGIPHFDTTVVYPGTCLIEGTNVTEGRGTPLPFEIIGAPWIDGEALAAELNALRLDGVRFRAVQFTPSEWKYPHQLCQGVQVHVTAREAVRPVTMGLQLIRTLREMYPGQFAWRAEHFDSLIGNTSTREQLERGVKVETITAAWEDEQAAFRARSRAYWLYD